MSAAPGGPDGANHAGGDVRPAIKGWILAELLPEEDPDELAYDTQLVTGGILDSISIFQLLGFLLQEWGVTLEPHEVANGMHTIDEIAALVEAKRGAGG